jgi:23S rRNA pseudouridine1911/1915/1917 synthase
VHRLDRDTSGLVVFARTAEAERHLGRQMRAHSIERKYLALVRGQARTERIESNLVEDRGDGRRGSTPKPGEGKRAVTQVKLLETLGEFSLVECQLETGRTHQVRIHLGERGTPLCGERIYDRPLHGRPVPDTSEAARPMLHASYLGIEHPATGERLHWSSPLPADMAQLQRRLRKHKKRPPSSASPRDNLADEPSS